MLYVNKTRELKLININNVTAEIRKVKRLKNEIVFPNLKKTNAFTRK